MGRQQVGAGRHERDRLGVDAVGLGLGEQAILGHQAEGDALAGLGGGEVGEGVVGRGRLGQAGDQGGLGGAQLAYRLGEVGLGGGLDAVSLGAVVDLIEVQVEDLVLAVGAAHAEGEDRLTQLALVALLAALILAEQDAAHQLHGDRGGAAHDLAALVVLERGAHDAAHVYAGVLIEVGVLHGDRGVFEQLRDLREAHRGTTPSLRANQLVEQGCAVASVEPGGLEAAILSDALGVGQVAAVAVVEPHAAGHTCEGDEQRELDEGEREAQAEGQQGVTAPERGGSAAPWCAGEARRRRAAARCE